MMKALRLAATLSGLDGGASASRSDTQLHVVLIGDAQIEELNEVYLGHGGPTDVIAFELQDEAMPGVPLVIGEIYVCLDVAVRMASELGDGLGREVMLYCVHGMLHLAGFDDRDSASRRAMQGEQARIVDEIAAHVGLDGLFGAWTDPTGSLG